MIGTVLGNYRLRSEIGRGGMGVVYVADHLHLARQVAVKVLLPELCSNPDAVRRLFQEARATSLIRHPGIVEIFDCDAPRPDTAFLVMELLAGESLASYLQRVGVLPRSATAVALVAQMAEAVGAAHAHGIFHRDLKPDNVFLLGDPGEASPRHIKVLDFGIAKLTAAAGGIRRTRTGAVVGTPFYMSPEQCRGSGTVDHRTDIYSFGCLLFEVLCRRPPFVYEGGGELLVAHISEPAPDPRTFAPDLPSSLAELILACLTKDPAGRPQSMDEVVARLREVAMRASDEPMPPLQVRDFTAELPWQGGTEPGTSPVDGAVIAPPGWTQPLPGQHEGGRPVVQARSARPAETTLGQTAGERVAGDQQPVRVRARPQIRQRVLAALVLVLVGGTGVGYWIYGQSTRSSATHEPGSGGHATGEPVASASASVPARSVLVEIEGAPAGLVLKVDGVEATAPVELAMGETTHLFEFAAPGFVPQRLRFDARRSRVVTLAMQRQPGPEAEPRQEARTPPPAPPPTSSPTPSPPAAANVRKKETRGATRNANKSDVREDKPKQQQQQRPRPQQSFRRFDDI